MKQKNFEFLQEMITVSPVSLEQTLQEKLVTHMTTAIIIVTKRDIATSSINKNEQKENEQNDETCPSKQ